MGCTKATDPAPPSSSPCLPSAYVAEIRGCGGPVNPVEDSRKKDQSPEPLSSARSVFVRYTTNLGVTHAQSGLSTRPHWVTTGPLPQLAYRCFSTIRARSRTRPTCSRPQRLARQGFRNSVLNGRNPELWRAELNRERCARSGPPASSEVGRQPLSFLGFSARLPTSAKAVLGRIGGADEPGNEPSPMRIRSVLSYCRLSI